MSIDPLIESALLGFGRVFLLTFARCLGTTLFAPIFGGADVSKITRAMIALALSASVLPLVLSEGAPIEASFGGLCDVCLGIGKEFVFGASIGLALAVFFNGVYLAGETIARVGGVSIVGIFDPIHGGETSPISRLFFWTSVALFIVLGGFEVFLEGYWRLFQSVPLNSGGDPADLAIAFVQLLASSFALGLKLAAPTLATTAIAYLVIGALGRSVAQLDFTAVAFNCNSLLTLIALFLTFGAFGLTFREEIARYLETILEIFVS